MRIIKLVLFSVIVLTATSCEETGVTSGKITVTGQVINGSHTLNNYIVSINGSKTTTNENGFFTIPNVDIPYNIIFTSSTPGGPVIVFNNISKPNINVSVSPEYNMPYQGKHAHLSAKIPQLGQGKMVLSSFVPENGQEKVFLSPFWNETHAGVDVVWHDADSISGRWVFVYYTVSNNLTITSFDRYYEKSPITIYEDLNLNDTLRENEPFTILNSGHLNGTVTNITGGFGAYTSLHFNFPNTITNIPLMNQSANPNFEYVIPTNIPTGLNFNLLAINGNTRIMEKVYSGVGNIVKLLSPPEILSPQILDSISFYNSPFEWTIGESNGIYQFYIYPDGVSAPPLWIFTDQTNLVIPDLSDFGYQYLGNGHIYRAFIKKYYSYGSINEYLTRDIRLEDYKGVSTSKQIRVRVY